MWDWDVPSMLVGYISLIKHDIPEQSHSISGNGNLDVFSCASSSVPFRLLFESWLRDGCFWGEHLCFWRPEKWSVTSVWVRWPPSAAVTWCFSSTVGHKDSPSTPANFLPYLWPSFSSRTPRCIPSSQKSCHILLRTEGKRICDFLPPWSWKTPPNTSMASQGYLLFNTSGLK